MIEFNLLVILGGVLGYLVSMLATVALVLLFIRLNVRMFKKSHALQLFQWTSKESPCPSPAPAIALGAATLSQAFLLRHAVRAIIAVIQDFLVEHGDRILTAQFPVSSFLRSALVACLIMVAVSALSVISVWLATYSFNLLTGDMKEFEEIESGNVAVAVLFAFFLFAVTALLNEGIQMLSRALVPFSRSGVVRWL